MDAKAGKIGKLVVRSISDNPPWVREAAEWFSDKWGVPAEEYEASMEEGIASAGSAVPQWFVVRDGDLPSSPIIAGCGIIENDFHDRKDLTPNLCALYVEERHRGKGVAKTLLDHARLEAAAYGFGSLYLVTDLVGFYERCGWKYLFDVNETGGGTVRMYRADTTPGSAGNPPSAT